MLDKVNLDALKDLKRFAPTFLTIRSKRGRPINFNFNQAQHYIHDRDWETL
jgi:hypothetical protein